MKKIFIIAVIIFIIIVGLLWNIYSAYISGDNANIYTAISGWVSGLATIILGIIALVQNFIFKNTNEKNAIKYDLSNKLNQLKDAMEKVNIIIDADEFLSIGLEYMHNLEDWKDSKIYEKVKTNIRYKYVYYKKANELAFLCRKINVDNLFFEHKNDLCILLDDALTIIFDIGDFYNSNDIETINNITLDINKFSKELSNLCDKINDKFFEYILEYEDFIDNLRTKSITTINEEIIKKKDLEKTRQSAFKSKLTK
ncbi:MAG: hypothetical protein VB017_06955 [Endomicrobiaceae bacterium]|nr:hypothetical protein [Endomicrobiaceae bacterium]